MRFFLGPGVDVYYGSCLFHVTTPHRQWRSLVALWLLRCLVLKPNYAEGWSISTLRHNKTQKIRFVIVYTAEKTFKKKKSKTAKKNLIFV